MVDSLDLLLEDLPDLHSDLKGGAPADPYRPPGRGKAPIFPGLLEVQDLTEEDLGLMAAAGPHHTTAQLQTVRENHHAIARYLAMGLRPVQISRLIGYSEVTISTLQKDALFVELIEFYKNGEEDFLDTFRQRLQALTFDALDALQERVMNEGSAMSPAFLKSLIESGADRLGHGPVRKSEERHTHTILSSEDISKLREDAARRSQEVTRAPRTVEGECTRVEVEVSGPEAAQEAVPAPVAVLSVGGEASPSGQDPPRDET